MTEEQALAQIKSYQSDDEPVEPQERDFDVVDSESSSAAVCLLLSPYPVSHCATGLALVLLLFCYFLFCSILSHQSNDDDGEEAAEAGSGGEQDREATVAEEEREGVRDATTARISSLLFADRHYRQNAPCHLQRLRFVEAGQASSSDIERLGKFVKASMRCDRTRMKDDIVEASNEAHAATGLFLRGVTVFRDYIAHGSIQFLHVLPSTITSELSLTEKNGHVGEERDDALSVEDGNGTDTTQATDGFSDDDNDSVVMLERRSTVAVL